MRLYIVAEVRYKVQNIVNLHCLLAEHSKREGISIVCIFFQEMMLFIQNLADFC